MTRDVQFEGIVMLIKEIPTPSVILDLFGMPPSPLSSVTMYSNQFQSNT